MMPRLIPLFKAMKFAFKSEINLQLHLISAVLVIFLGFIISIDFFEFILILCCILLVITAEIINTCIEQFLNQIHPEFHSKVGIIKDISAAAVLIISFISLLIGIMIFIPKIISLF